MPKTIPDAICIARPELRRAPVQAPRGLERLATACLKAEAGDSRLGDLSEQYVRTHERARKFLGNAPLAMTVSQLAADVRYLFSAGNVTLYARAVDPVFRLSEPGARETVVLDLKERTMAMLHIAVRKLVVTALLLVGGAFLINGAFNAWTTWRETEALLVSLQREKAQAAATEIGQFFAVLQDQVRWAGMHAGSGVPPEQVRSDFVRLQRQAPAIVAISQIDAEGKEVVMVSRLIRDTIGSGADFSADPRFVEARKRGSYVGLLYFKKQSEPYVSLAISHAGPRPSVTVAEVNVKYLWEFIDTVRVGETGYAYVVDENGRLIAGRDRAQVLRQADLSTLPQVAAASSPVPSGSRSDGVTFDTSPSGAAVVSVHAAVPSTAWKVFVEVPVAEAHAPLWAALARVLWLLGLGLVTIVLASVAAARREAPAQPARI